MQKCTKKGQPLEPSGLDTLRYWRLCEPVGPLGLEALWAWMLFKPAGPLGLEDLRARSRKFFFGHELLKIV